MRTLLVKIIQLLDGTPAVYGKRQSGQSVVELALVTPLLIILLAGLVEIGWFANNYLNLLDVTRAGARRGAVLQDQTSPMFWENMYTYVPKALLPAVYQMEYTSADDTETSRFWYRWMPEDTGPGGVNEIPGSTGLQACSLAFRPVRPFYNEVICTMITTMEPMEMNFENGIDDIIVSGFAMQEVEDPTLLAPYPTGRALDPTIYGNSPQVVVAGRYPTNANECNYQLDASGNAVLIGDVREGRDPFDIDNDGVDIKGQGGAVFTEISGYENGLTSPEKQVGFSLFGNHKIPGYACVGSEWTMREIQNLMNLSTYDQSVDAMRNAPSQGVVLVEMYWEHEMLLKLPLLSPVYTAVGNADGRMVINIWAAFPLSSVEPHILFP